MLNLVFFDSAQEDLFNIKTYLGSKIGKSFIFDLKKELYYLCEFPNVGIELEENSRRFIYNRKYYIYYLILDNNLIIVNVTSIKQSSYVDSILRNMRNFN
ncbi:MAG: type II toxin-antitoxin system RelE/ParE family toxin [Nanoarchaeales archaeon]|nr:type II toxin-antitoxin system RelE/ParE family toxin [Nanoarchaeales archaeon]